MPWLEKKGKRGMRRMPLFPLRAAYAASLGGGTLSSAGVATGSSGPALRPPRGNNQPIPAPTLPQAQNSVFYLNPLPRSFLGIRLPAEERKGCGGNEASSNPATQILPVFLKRAQITSLFLCLFARQARFSLIVHGELFQDSYRSSLLVDRAFCTGSFIRTQELLSST